MSDTLTNDAIARLIVNAGRNSYVSSDSVRWTTITVECVEMLCGELLRLRADRDAAVAEAVAKERERCLAILGSNEFWVSVEDAIRRGE